MSLQTPSLCTDLFFCTINMYIYTNSPFTQISVHVANLQKERDKKCPLSLREISLCFMYRKGKNIGRYIGFLNHQISLSVLQILYQQGLRTHTQQWLIPNTSHLKIKQMWLISRLVSSLCESLCSFPNVAVTVQPCSQTRLTLSYHNQ